MALTETQAQIAALHREDAERLIDKSKKYPLVVATGPFRMGKTESLIPQMVNCGRTQGINSLVYNFQSSEYDSKEFAKQMDQLGQNLVSLPERRVLIGDEAGVIPSYSTQHVDTVLRTAEQSGSGLISVVAYKSGEHNVRDDLSKKWLEAKYGNIYPEDALVHLSTKYLPRGLAEDLLNYGSGGNFTDEQVARLLGILPHHPWILETISVSGSLEAAQQFIRSNAYNWTLNGLITPEQERSIISQTAEELQVKTASKPSPRAAYNWQDRPVFKGLTDAEIEADGVFSREVQRKQGQFFTSTESLREEYYRLLRQGGQKIRLNEMSEEVLRQYAQTVYGLDIKQIEDVPTELRGIFTDKSDNHHLFTEWKNKDRFTRPTFRFQVDMPSERSKLAVFHVGPIADGYPAFVYSGAVFVRNPHVLNEQGQADFHYDGGNYDLILSEMTSIITR